MTARNDEVKAIFRDLLSETSAAVEGGSSVADAIAAASSIGNFARLADAHGVLRVFLADTLDKPRPLTDLKPEQLGPNLVEYFEAYRRSNGGDVAFNSEAFEAFWSAGADEILNYAVSLTRFVGLVNIDTEGNTYELMPGITLRPLERALDERWMSFVGPLPHFLTINSVLEVHYKARIDHGGPHFHASVRAHDLFQIAVALQQDAASGEAVIIDRIDGIRLGGNMSLKDGPNPWGRPLFIRPSDAVEIRILMTRFEAATKSSDDRARRVARAGEAYRSAVTRRVDLIGEQLIDSWMTLESLFGEKRETTFLLALRIPAFVETDPGKRRDLYAQVEEDYGKRSTYIHGGHIEEKDLPSERTMALARRALLRVLEAPSPYPHAPSQIELSLLEAGTLPAPQAPV